MATVVHRQEVLLSDLTTRAVTLYPSRALISREIPNINLKPGANEVEIYGLTPTTDEHSIKIDGIGSASVTDMTIDLVENKISFAQAYPDQVEAEDSDSEDESEDDDNVSPDVKDLRKEIDRLQTEYDKNQSHQTTISHRIGFLHQWYKSIESRDLDAPKLAEFLDLYQDQRTRLNEQHVGAIDSGAEVRKLLTRKQTQLKKATRATRRAMRQNEIEKAKDQRQQQLKLAAGRREKQRVKEERAKYWPRKVYRVTVHLDVPVDTPGSSRRSSVSSITLAKDSLQANTGDESVVASHQTSFMLSYVTSSASWQPRYDIDFSTSQKSGKVVYRAEFMNHTSETWDQAKVSLSTSQASFRGLGDEVPWMRMWTIGLAKHSVNLDALTSFQEKLQKTQDQHQTQQHTTRNEWFGMDTQSQSSATALQMSRVSTKSNSVDSSGMMKRQKGFTPAAASAPSPAAAPPSGYSSHGAISSHGALRRRSARRADFEEDEDMGFGAVDDMVESHRSQAIDSEESTWEDHGLTTTYDIPGTRTLAPSSLTRRHKIASLPFSNLILTSIAVPKLRQAAFLRARFRNPSSSITLLKGTAGLTLDGTFLGNTTLPRVSPGELITLPLGVDPALHLSYAKPSVKRSTQGIFNKESAQVFTRSIVVTNTKSATIDLLVLDQIPVSEDEKLRVEILQPSGLFREGDSVPTGTNAQEGKKGEGKNKWGSAKVTLKHNGELAYNVVLEKGAACRLAIEYEARAPSSEGITSK